MACVLSSTTFLLVDWNLKTICKVHAGERVRVCDRDRNPQEPTSYPVILAGVIAAEPGSEDTACALVERLFTTHDLYHLGLDTSRQEPSLDPLYVCKSLPFRVLLTTIDGPVLPPLKTKLPRFGQSYFLQSEPQPVSVPVPDPDPDLDPEPEQAVPKRRRLRSVQAAAPRHQELDPELEAARSYRRVLALAANPDSQNLFCYTSNEDSSVWLANPDLEVRARLDIGRLLFVRILQEPTSNMEICRVKLVRVEDDLGLSDQDSGHEDKTTDMQIVVDYLYSREDLIASGFDVDELRKFSIETALSNHRQRVSLSSVAGLVSVDEAAAACAFFYDVGVGTLSGFSATGGRILLTRQDQDQERRDGCEDEDQRRVVEWAQAEPHEELATEFGQKIMTQEFQLLNEFGPAAGMKVVVRRLDMIPHMLVPERGLTPFSDWKIKAYQPHFGQKQCCDACGLKRVLSKQLTSSSRHPILLGSECASKLECLMKCCAILEEIRGLVLGNPKDPPMQEIREKIAEISRLVTENRSAKEDLRP